MSTVKLQDTKSMCKNPLLFYIVTMKLQEKNEKIRKTISFVIPTKTIKYLRINLTKDVKGLHTKNYKGFLKETEKDTMK